MGIDIIDGFKYISNLIQGEAQVGFALAKASCFKLNTGPYETFLVTIDIF